jgi:hypothetical protein
MKAMSKVIDRDVIDGNRIPSDEILKGKVYRQRGKYVTEHGVVDYFFERIPGTEGKTQVLNSDLSIVEVDGAEFEMHVKNPDTGDWDLIQKDMLPTNPADYPDPWDTIF